MTKETLSALLRCKETAVALFGALAFVGLLRVGGGLDSNGDFENNPSPAAIIGKNISDGMGTSWFVLAPYIGALGSFFAGSTTVSNQTFGPVQAFAAANLNLSGVTLLAVQSAGSASGNMIAISNVLTAKAVVFAKIPKREVVAEREFVLRTLPACLILCTGTMALSFFIYFMDDV
jgi:lactate permease